jgi:hypothetical protein
MSSTRRGLKVGVHLLDPVRDRLPDAGEVAGLDDAQLARVAGEAAPQQHTLGDIVLGVLRGKAAGRQMGVQLGDVARHGEVRIEPERAAPRP